MRAALGTELPGAQVTQLPRSRLRRPQWIAPRGSPRFAQYALHSEAVHGTSKKPPVPQLVTSFQRVLPRRQVAMTVVSRLCA